MGNSLLNSALFLGESVSQYELLFEDPKHHLKYLEHLPTKSELVLRQINIIEPYMMRNMLQVLKNKENTLKHPHLFEIVRYNSIAQDYGCNSLPKLAVVSQYSHRTIDDQTSERCLQRRPYTEQQLWTILASCILALGHLEKMNIRHECLRSGEIFISNQGFIKIKDPIITGTLTNLEQLLRNRNSPHLYISPELCESLAMAQADDTFDSHKSDVFTLAMIILEIGLLEYQDSCYKSDWTVIDWIQIEDNWLKFRKIYSHQLADILMDCMLVKNPKLRNGWEDLEYNIKKIDTMEKSNNNRSPQQKSRVEPARQQFVDKPVIRYRVVRSGSSQSPPTGPILPNSPRILQNRTNYHNQKHIHNLESNILIQKSSSNSPTLHPLKLINRRIPQQLILNKTIINPPVIHLNTSPKRKIYQKSPKTDMKQTTKFLKRIKDYKRIPNEMDSFDKTVKYFIKGQGPIRQ